jgi:hypothetical protein
MLTRVWRKALEVLDRPGRRGLLTLPGSVEGAERLALQGLGSLFLGEHGFHTTSRDDAADPWTRDYVYGVNTRRISR